MKYLSTYSRLGLSNNNDDVFDFLINTMSDTITKWNDLVDFSKVFSNINGIERELALLNTLIGKNDLETELIDLLSAYPNVRKALPLLVALRLKRKNKRETVHILSPDGNKIENLYDLFDPGKPLSSDMVGKIIDYFRYSGLDEIFRERNIKSVVDYGVGVEVGLDSNARKNRNGILMQNKVASYLNSIKLGNTIDFIEQPTGASLKSTWNFDLSLDKTNKEFDFAVRNTGSGKIVLIETNFYNGGGSKLNSTAREYKGLQDLLSRQDIPFVWITDGAGWRKTKSPLKDTFLHNDYIFNLHLLQKGALIELLNT